MAKYIDYSSINFTDSQVNYMFSDGGDVFVATVITFLATEVCLVRFGSPTADQHKIKKNTYMKSNKTTREIFIVRDSTNGTVEVWAEGNLLG